ncbi:hypothetical protein GBAR_LOCUS5293 [Geodia barretti]|uniref:Uncharacterized protein n=1 Tax=Geodia barretti TaxID=519541 RepID=A0AA35RBH4_GEOBA|nr:hypothetical protein GBAR_LOCUS5293 [Geodia barretti]
MRAATLTKLVFSANTVFISYYILVGLTQTPFGKKSDASDSASEIVKREVAEARGPRRTDAYCVSPILG